MEGGEKEKTDWLGINQFKKLSLGRKIFVGVFAVIGLVILLGNVLSFILASLLSVPLN